MRIGPINQRAIEALTDAAEVRRRVGAGAQRVAVEARRLAPVRTGALRSSITVDEVNGEFRVGWDPTVAPYGPLVEFGTEDTTPQPHLRPAAIKVGGR